jgi:hypothetical protein
MSEDASGIVVGVIVFGLAFIVGGLLFHLGCWRSWYLTPDTIFGARPALYGFVPMGLAIICFAIVILLPSLETRRTVGAYVILPLAILAVILSFWQPKWLKPKWVRWLEENNQDILELIVEEGRKTKEWGKVVATQEGLEAWVAEVRRKHNRPRPTMATGELRSEAVPIGLVILAVSSGLGQLFLGSGLIGFIGGWALLGLIYLLRPKEREGGNEIQEH